MTALAPDTIRARLAEPGQRQAALVELAEWVKNSCLLVGTSADTAYTVAGMFVKGIGKSWERQEGGRV